MQLGADGAARLACLVMLIPQLVVVALLVSWWQPLAALAVTGLVVAQTALMLRFLQDPRRYATWYSGFGVTLYVLGMLASAFAVRGIVL